MMKTILTFYFALFTFTICTSQNWTLPVNVSNLEYSGFPDIAVDDKGVIHIVWTEIIGSTLRKIMYSYSNNDGETWSIPFDLSQNNEKECGSANIVVDSKNSLYVTWDYNVGNPYETYVHMKIFDGQNWGSTIVVSENMPASHNNVLVKDNADRIYVFWDRGYKFCYRYLENNTWSNVNFPYEEQHSICNAVPDSDNNLHCVGQYTYWLKTVPGVRITYFKYDKTSEQWSDVEIINEDDVNIAADIDLDANTQPQIIWNKYVTHSTPWVNSSVYCQQTGINNWSDEYIIEDYVILELQKIHVSYDNVVNVFFSKKLGVGWDFDHYYKINENWYSARIDSSYSYMITGAPNVSEKDGKLYITYYKCHGPGDCDIMFSKSDLVDGQFHAPNILNDRHLNIYPNPFLETATIKISIATGTKVSVKIYDVLGNLTKNLCEVFLQPGKHQFCWDGTNDLGNSVNRGIYLVRLIENENLETQILQFVK